MILPAAVPLAAVARMHCHQYCKARTGRPAPAAPVRRRALAKRQRMLSTRRARVMTSLDRMIGGPEVGEVPSSAWRCLYEFSRIRMLRLRKNLARWTGFDHLP